MFVHFDLVPLTLRLTCRFSHASLSCSWTSHIVRSLAACLSFALQICLMLAVYTNCHLIAKSTFALGCARPDSCARSCRAECELPWLSCHLTSPALFALHCACAETWEPSNTSTVLADCVQRPCKPELQAVLVVHSAVSASIVCQVGRMQAVCCQPRGSCQRLRDWFLPVPGHRFSCCRWALAWVALHWTCR